MADDAGEGAEASTAPPLNAEASTLSRASLTSRRGIDGHHGFSLRPPRTRAADSIASDNAVTALVPAKQMEASEIADVVERLYAEAATKKENRKKPPPDRHPQGGLEFHFDEAKRLHYTTRKPAAQLSKEDYTAACARKFDEGVPKKREKHAALMAKYCPGINPADLDPIPARNKG